MNERIRELADQALKQPDTDNDGLTVLDNNELEKFAELIVRECANMFDKDEMELTLTNRTIHNMIKEHFGVEE